MKFFSLPNKQPQTKRLFVLSLSVCMAGLLALAFLAGSIPGRVQASLLAQDNPTPTPDTAAGAPQTHSGDCLTCHAKPNFTGTFENGESISLSIDGELAKTNLHLRLGSCGVCHTGFDNYPHPTTKASACTQCHNNGDGSQAIQVSLPFKDARSLVVAMNIRCSTCHENKYIALTNGSHARIFKSGNLSAPMCSDCHSSHTIRPVAQTNTSLYCAKCHASSFNSLKTSIHGESLAKQAPADAPTCSTCHSSHSLNGPSDPDFRKNSVAICLKCHQDKAMMDRYNLPSDLFDTHVDNFHTMKVDVLERQDMNVTGDAPVCIDCHGAHSVRANSDQGSSISSTNLLVTCLKCHSGQTGFVVAGRAHFSSSSSAIQTVDGIQKFFSYFIPINFALLVIYILLDARKLWIERRRRA